MPTVQVGAAIGESFKFIGVAWRRAWGIMTILVWITAAQQAMIVLRPEWTFVPLLGLLASAAVSTATVGALYRIGIEADHAGDPQFQAHTAGLQWGALEWRVLGANMLLGLVIGGAITVVVLIWAVAFGVSIAGDQAAIQALNGTDENARMVAIGHLIAGPVGIVTLVIFVTGVIAFIYVLARLALYSLTAADTRSFGFGRAWALSRGAVLAIIVTQFVIGLAELIAAGVMYGLGAAIASAAGGGAATQLWGGVGSQVLIAAIATPLFVGLQLYVYRTKRVGERSDAGIAATFS